MADLVPPVFRVDTLARDAFLTDECRRERVTLDHRAFHHPDFDLSAAG